MMKKVSYVLRIALVVLVSIAILPIRVEAKAPETIGDLRREYEAVLAEKRKIK